jgi:hypothetical protein
MEMRKTMPDGHGGLFPEVDTAGVGNTMKGK